VDTVRHLTLAEIRECDIRADAQAGRGHPVSALKCGALSPGAVAVAGADGYLFISNGANRWERQYLGELTLDPSWFEAWLRLFAGRQAEAQRRGVPLWNFVAPEKQVVYPDMRWPGGGTSGARRPLRQLLAGLGPEAQLIYPEAELEAARALGPAFLRHNSHWTASGCCGAAAPLIAALGTALDWTEQRFAYRVVREPQDLSAHFLDPTPDEDAGWLAVAGEVVFDNRAFQTTGRHAGSSYGVRNPAAPDPRSLVIFGDSYAYDAGLTACLSAVFARVTFIWSKAVIWDAAAEHQADLVVWESAERFLTTVPQA
jgi:alginate O-acetyltransferase complex protein AlgJ